MAIRRNTFIPFGLEAGFIYYRLDIPAKQS
jgi:hypothetical protein